MLRWMVLVGILVSVLVGVPPGTSTAASAASSACLSSLELDVPGPEASVFARVTVPEGHIFEADILSTMEIRRTFIAHYDDWNGSVALLPRRVDGFPGGPAVGADSFMVQDHKWSPQVEQGELDGIRITNSSSSTSDLLVELNYSFYRTELFQEAKTILSDFVVEDPSTGIRRNACVRAHTTPDRPQTTCTAMPAIDILGDGDVRSEPFEMAPGSELTFQMLDEKLVGITDGVFDLNKWYWTVQIALVGAGQEVNSPGNPIAKTDHTARLGWSRDAYLGAQKTLSNRSTSSQVQLVMWISYRYEGLLPPSVSSVANVAIDGEGLCLNSTATTAAWDLVPNCAWDDSSAFGATVRNTSLTRKAYVVELRHPNTKAFVHASHRQWVDAGRGVPVWLGGVPDGRWLIQIVEYDSATDTTGKILFPQRYMSFDNHQICVAPRIGSLVWEDGPHCSHDNTMAIGAEVRNNGERASKYRVELIDMRTNVAFHGSHEYTIEPRRWGRVVLGGIPRGSWYVRVLENGEQLGAGSAYTFVGCEQTSCPSLDKAKNRLPLTSRETLNVNETEIFFWDWDEEYASNSVVFADGVRVVRATDSDRYAVSPEIGLKIKKILELKGESEIAHTRSDGSLYVFEANAEQELKDRLRTAYAIQGYLGFESIRQSIKELYPQYSDALVQRLTGFWASWLEEAAFGDERMDFQSSSWAKRIDFSAGSDLADFADIAGKSPVDNFAFPEGIGKIKLAGSLGMDVQQGDIVLARQVHPSASGDPSVVTSLQADLSGQAAFDLFGIATANGALKFTSKATFYQGLNRDPQREDAGTVSVDRVSYELTAVGGVGGSFDLLDALNSLRSGLDSRYGYQRFNVAAYDNLARTVSVGVNGQERLVLKLKITIFDPSVISAETLMSGQPGAMLDLVETLVANPDAWKVTVEAHRESVVEESLSFDPLELLGFRTNGISGSTSTKVTRKSLLGAFVLTGCGSDFVAGR